MPDLSAANVAKSEKHLAQLIRTSAFGVTTKKDRLIQAKSRGFRLEVASVRDEARERAIEREMKAMMGGGWGVPTGNECHPVTIKYNKLKAELAAKPQTLEYRMHLKGEEYYNVLSKTEHEFAVSL